MRRRFLIAVLALGTIGGYGLGFATMRCHGQARRDAWEHHVAKVCIDAANDKHEDRGDRRNVTDDDEAR